MIKTSMSEPVKIFKVGDLVRSTTAHPRSELRPETVCVVVAINETAGGAIYPGVVTVEYEKDGKVHRVWDGEAGWESSLDGLERILEKL